MASRRLEQTAAGRNVEAMQPGKIGSKSLPPNSLIGSEVRRLAVDIRVILIGKTGSGKSSTGNTILRKNSFATKPGATSVTRKCSFSRACVLNRNVLIVDTPGWFDSHLPQEEIRAELAKCIGLAVPGPHVFLLTIPANTRITPEECDTLDLLRQTFGESMVDHTIVVFTKADEMKRQLLTERNFLKDLPHKVDSFIKLCKGKPMFLANYASAREGDVEALLSRMEFVIDQNGLKYYSNKDFEDAKQVMLTNRKKRRSNRKQKPNLSDIQEEDADDQRNTDRRTRDVPIVVDMRQEVGVDNHDVADVGDPEQEDIIDDQDRQEIADGGGILDTLIAKLKSFWGRVRRFFQ